MVEVENNAILNRIYIHNLQFFVVKLICLSVISQKTIFGDLPIIDFWNIFY